MQKEGDSMRIGFVGAGKMGNTLGKHLKDSGLVDLVGYYSKTVLSAKEAAQFTDTKYYEDLRELVCLCDAVFLTVPDGQIAVMAKVLDGLGDCLDGKILCHTSGALDSGVFSGIRSHVYGYSIHPIYAVSSKTESYKDFKQCFITIEGSDTYINELSGLFSDIGHSVKIIDASDKVRYHGAAVMASNLVIGLYHMAKKELMQCGFGEEEAKCAIDSLFIGNANNIVACGESNALTGPVERCDTGTVMKHLNTFSGDSRRLYSLLSKQLVEIAAIKHEDKCDSYRQLVEILDMSMD